MLAPYPPRLLRTDRRIQPGEYAGLAVAAARAQFGSTLSELSDWSDIVEDRPYLATQMPHAHGAQGLGERWLMAELLQGAVHDLRAWWNRPLRQQAHVWITDSFLPHWCPAVRFGYVCEVLSLDAEAVRAALLGPTLPPKAGSLRGYATQRTQIRAKRESHARRGCP